MTLHPRLARWLPRLTLPQAGDPESATPEQLRALGRAPTPGPVAEVGHVEDVSVANGTLARLYRPEGVDPARLVLFFHGGGFVLGTLDTHDALCRQLAVSAGASVLSIDYPLAPECPFPAAVECAVSVLDWAHATGAESLGLRATRLAVAGDSAGGGIAAALAQHALARDVPVCVQGLMYPVVDCDFDRPSYREHGEGLNLTRPLMQWFLHQYLGGDSRSDDPRAVPLRAGAFAGLCPAVVMTVEYDVLRDEGVAYAEALAAAGVEVAYRHLPDMLHGVFNLAPIFEPARAQLEWFGEGLGARLG